MAHLADILAYLLDNYPHDREMSNARVTKIIYLADWHHSLNHGQQISEIKWKFEHYGPFVPDVKKLAEDRNDLFVVVDTVNLYGSPKIELKRTTKKYEPLLKHSERESIDHIIKTTKTMWWNQFIQLVYSTYPILSSPRYEYLDLPTLARQYKKQEAE